MSAPYILIRKHLTAHWLRSLLTISGMVLGLLLFCMVVSIQTSMNSVLEESAGNRLVVQSAVSLFVALPLDYQQKIASVPGVENVAKFQWFGGYYKEPKNFFAQFGTDHDRFLDMYTRDLEIAEGPGGVTGPAARDAVIAAMSADRRAAIIGLGLVRDYQWNIGQTVPVISPLFQKEAGWEFNIVGTYRPKKSNVDDRTMFFRYDYLQEALFEGTATGPIGVGTYVVNVAKGADPAAVQTAIDALFASGPQATQTPTEAAFQAGFISMLGNLPLFIGTIGGAVVFAVLFSVVNTMLLAGRQRLQEAGILKALGFTDGAVGLVLLLESVLIGVIGGGLGVGLAALLAIRLREVVGTMIPNFAIEPSTIVLGLGLSLVIGVVSGIAPAVIAMRIGPTEAMRSEG